jgi:hypothetical protein
MGIESGSTRIQQLCRKNVKLDRVIPAVRKARELGLTLTTSFIAGFPYEETDDIEKTIRMMAAVHYEGRAACTLQMHLLSPVPGAPLTREPDIEIALDEFTSDLSTAGHLDDIMRGWISQHGKPIFESFYHYVNHRISRRCLLEIRSGWFTLFTALQFTAIALEQARRNDDFALVSVFDDCDRLESVDETETVFEWCTRSVRRFLQRAGKPWASAVLAILEFEAMVHRLRLEGGNRLIECEYEVNEWVEQAAKSDSLNGLPDLARTRYFIMGRGKDLKVARLPTVGCVRPA